MKPEVQVKPEVTSIGIQCDLLNPMSSLPLLSYIILYRSACTPIKNDVAEYETDTTTTEEGLDDTYTRRT